MNIHKAEARTWVSHLLCVCVWTIGVRITVSVITKLPNFFDYSSICIMLKVAAGCVIQPGGLLVGHPWYRRL